MRTRRTLYWLLAGALMGFGVIGILSIGFPFLLVGLGLTIFLLIRRWLSGAWALLVGFGGLPALILAFDVLTAPPPCPPGPVTLQPGGGRAGGARWALRDGRPARHARVRGGGPGSVTWWSAASRAPARPCAV
jgi:hypothetical protein